MNTLLHHLATSFRFGFMQPSCTSSHLLEAPARSTTVDSRQLLVATQSRTFWANHHRDPEIPYVGKTILKKYFSKKLNFSGKTGDSSWDSLYTF